MKLSIAFLSMGLILSCKTTTSTKGQASSKGAPEMLEVEMTQDEFLEKCKHDKDTKQVLEKLTGTHTCEASYETVYGADYPSHAHEIHRKIPKVPPVVVPSPASVAEHEKAEAGKTLKLYDSCRNEWFDTKLPFREHPAYPHPKVDPRMLPQIPGDPFYLRNGNILLVSYLDIFNVERYINPGNDQIPPVLRGIWWMDGNPQDEVLVGTSSGFYSEQTKTFSMYYSDDGAYSWLPNESAKWAMTKIFYNLGHSMNIEFGKLDPYHLKPGDEVEAKLSNRFFSYKWFISTPTVYIEDGLWRRLTGIYPAHKQRSDYHCYNMRRIVDEFGNKLPTYDYFVETQRKRIKESDPWHEDVLIYPKKIGTHH